MATSEGQTSFSNQLLVAAFDFGTTYSGYAFSFFDKPLKVKANQSWVAGSDELVSLKTPTCVLLEPNQQFHSFGYEAENKFTSLAEDGDHHDWYFFRRFKMLLYNTENLTRKTTIEDISGKTMPAMTIFAMSLRYLKEHLLKLLLDQVGGIEETDIMYVITIPAIWNDKAKQFMREAAIEANIDTKRLKMALEPEAASIWCQEKATEKEGDAISADGSQYMVIDLGGGTADISVHENQSDGTLKELHKASGGAWGGNAVDDNYIQMLTNLFGKQVMERFKNEQMEDYFSLLREFETKKRTIKSTTEKKITFRVSGSLKEIFEEGGEKLNDKIAASDLRDKITVTADKMRIDASVVKSWFEVPITRLIDHVNDILSEKKMEAVSMVVLVGGFGESSMVQDKLRAMIKTKTLIIPYKAGLVVLKGAVRFGYMPDIVSSRIMKLTYGIRVSNQFDSNIHSEEERCEKNEMCRDVFYPFAKVGEEIKLDEVVRKEGFVLNGKTKTTLNIYTSERVDPSYTTDPTCKCIGKLKMKYPKSTTGEAVDVMFIFGKTELLVKVRMQKSDRTYETIVDCLS